MRHLSRNKKETEKRKKERKKERKKGAGFKIRISST